MSGTLPSWSKTSEAVGGWRRSSHVMDGRSATGATDKYYPGADLQGGLYENGGHLKVSVSQAATTSLLAYAGINWMTPSSNASSTWAYLYKQVQWVADYLQRCNYESDKFVAQIGDFTTDDRYWGRPESQPEGDAAGTSGWRPVYTISVAQGRGADVVGQATAAVMGAALMAYKAGDTTTAKAYAVKAETLYTMTKQLEGVYFLPDGNITQLSRTYRDDVAWAAAWMCRWQVETINTTAQFCTEALQYWDEMQATRGSQPYLSTDNMAPAVAMLLRDTMGMQPTIFPADTYLAQFTAMLTDAYNWYAVTSKSNTCDPCEDTGICTTPDGFVMLNKHGSAHFSANMALVALSSAEPGPGDGGGGGSDLSDGERATRRCWARSQIGYLLGNNTAKQAFLVGLNKAPSGLTAGIKVPARPRHRGASCPMDSDNCVLPSVDNPYVLTGALVGGPGYSDGYTDSRNSVGSLVSIEYNAGFTAALAALVNLESDLKKSGTNSLTVYCNPSAAVTTEAGCLDAQAALDRHNTLRLRHQAPDLTWNTQLASASQTWAAYLASRGCGLQHDANRGNVGENLYAASGTTSQQCVRSVDAWYSEISQYNFTSTPWTDNSGHFGKIGHFTQVVWVGSTQVGCGAASGSNCYVVACRYSPPGNYIGDATFKANVLLAQ